MARNSFIAGSQAEYDIILAEGEGVPVRYSGQLTYQCECVTFGGKWYAAENNTGRLTDWVSRELAKLQKGE